MYDSWKSYNMAQLLASCLLGSCEHLGLHYIVRHRTCGTFMTVSNRIQDQSRVSLCCNISPVSPSTTCVIESKTVFTASRWSSPSPTVEATGRRYLVQRFPLKHRYGAAARYIFLSPPNAACSLFLPYLLCCGPTVNY
jgi:hypothetical protein